MATHTKTKGTRLQVRISGVYTDVPKIKELTPPAVSKESLDATTLESTSVEKDQTIPDGENVVAVIFEDPNNSVHQYLRAAAAAEQTDLFKVILADPNADTESFTGQVIGWSPGPHGPKGIREVTVTIQNTGIPTNS